MPLSVAAALQAANIPTAAIAVVAEEIGANRPTLSINAGQPMNPASLMKLVTTYAGLEILGPAYTWGTDAYVVGKLTRGVLDGDLYLKGGGDPKLTFEQFWGLLRQLRARGVWEIRGDLVLDRTRFAPLDEDPGHFDGEPLRAYNVAPDALLLNYKSLRLRFIPGLDKITVLPEPQPSQLDVINLLRRGDGPCEEWSEQVRIDLMSRGAHPRLVVTGAYPAACGEKTRLVSPLTHAEYILGVFRELWMELGGKFAGRLREAPVPDGLSPVASVESPTLVEVVRDINKFSNNVMARQLYLTIAAEHSGRPAAPADADDAIRAWLAREELSLPELVLENGAGLSRIERISAAGLARLLQAAFRGPFMPEFIASLPIVAVNGTMKKRLQGDGTAGKAHIKTGTLEGVKTIAGYVLDRAGKYNVVVFLINHPDAAAGRAAQDALLRWVYEREGETRNAPMPAFIGSAHNCSYPDFAPAVEREPAADHPIADPHADDRDGQPIHQYANDRNDEQQRDQQRQHAPQHGPPKGPDLPTEVAFEVGSAHIAALHIVEDHRDDRRQTEDEGADDGRRSGNADHDGKRVQTVDQVSQIDQRVCGYIDDLSGTAVDGAICIHKESFADVRTRRTHEVASSIELEGGRQNIKNVAAERYCWQQHARLL